MQEVQCKTCRMLEQITDEEFFCGSKGKSMNGVHVTAIRTCATYQPAEEFGDEVRADMETADPRPMLPIVPVEVMREAIVEMNKTKKKAKRRTSGRKVISPDLPGKMVEMYAQGVSSDEIGRQLGVSGNCVRKYLKKMGVKIRPAAKVKGSKDKQHRCVSRKMQDVSQMTHPEAPKVIVVDDGEPELPRHLPVTAESLVKSIDEHNAKQPRFHCAEDNLEEFLRDWFGNLAPRRLYQLPEHIREAADKLTRALFEGRAA